MHLRRFVKLCFKSVRENVSVSTGFLFFLTAAFFFVPIQWIGAWMLALAIHELCHYVALLLCGGSVTSVQISCRGVIMTTDSLSLGKEAICAYAGPLFALILLLFARYLPRTAICTLFLSAYNLLPIFPLDGGRGLGCLVRKFLPTTAAERVLRHAENSVLLGILSIGFYSAFCLGLGILPAVIAVLLFLRSKEIKIPCKKWWLGVQ